MKCKCESVDVYDMLCSWRCRGVCGAIWWRGHEMQAPHLCYGVCGEGLWARVCGVA